MTPDEFIADQPATPDAARARQRDLADQVICQDDSGMPRTLTGVDVAYARDSDLLVAAAVTLDASTLDVLEIAHYTARAQFPYVPGLFSFRELPPILGAIQQLQQPPELIICDGQGIAHPRRFGLASHLGVILQMPTIGCAKTRLYGRAKTIPGPQRGDRVFLLDDTGNIVGAELRTQDSVRPVYVSIGHRISLDTACSHVLHAARHYRQPETTRQADQQVRRVLKTM